MGLQEVDAMTLTDARGVPIAPGDTAIYGFGVGRSVAMAEAVVLGEGMSITTGKASVSLTPSGRVRLRVVRRSYSSGERPVVDVAPDRLVVLKEVYSDGRFGDGPVPALPPSPLPTQDEKVRMEIEGRIKSYTEDLRSDTITWGVTHFRDLAEFHAYAAKRLAELRKKLEALDAST